MQKKGLIKESGTPDFIAALLESFAEIFNRGFFRIEDDRCRVIRCRDIDFHHAYGISEDRTYPHGSIGSATGRNIELHGTGVIRDYLLACTGEEREAHQKQQNEYLIFSHCILL